MAAKWDLTAHITTTVLHWDCPTNNYPTGNLLLRVYPNNIADTQAIKEVRVRKEFAVRTITELAVRYDIPIDNYELPKTKNSS